MHRYVIIILIWGVRNISWARDIFGAIDLDYGTFPVTKQEPQAVNNEPDNVIFSKYIKKPSEMLNYSFSKLYNEQFK